MGGVLSSVTGAVGGITKSILGGGDKDSSQDLVKNIQAPGSVEQGLNSSVNDQLQSLLNNGQYVGNQNANAYSQQTDPIAQLFKTNLTKYLSTGQDGKIDPNVLQNATQFVDQTFTQPAQQLANLTNNQFQAQQAETAARLGRQVSDSSLQSQLNQQMLNTNAQIGTQRGNLINQQANFTQFQNPVQQLQTGAQGLTGLQQNSQFINNLNQQAFTNRLSLLNGQSGQAGRYQNERIAGAGMSVDNQGPSKGLLGSIGGLGSTAYSGVKAIGSLFG